MKCQKLDLILQAWRLTRHVSSKNQCYYLDAVWIVKFVQWPDYWQSDRRSVFRFPIRPKGVPLHQLPRRVLSPTHPPIHWTAGVLSPGIKRPGRETDRETWHRRRLWKYGHNASLEVLAVECLMTPFLWNLTPCKRVIGAWLIRNILPWSCRVCRAKDHSSRISGPLKLTSAYSFETFTCYQETWHHISYSVLFRIVASVDDGCGPG